MRGSRIRVWVVCLALLVPGLAVARPPACCAPAQDAPAARSCCPAKIAAQAAGPRGCCKAPVPSRSEAPAPHAQPVACSGSEPALAEPAPLVHDDMPAVATLRAQRDHRAVSPDDSPPDRLTANRSLLI